MTWSLGEDSSDWGRVRRMAAELAKGKGKGGEQDSRASEARQGGVRAGETNQAVCFESTLRQGVGGWQAQGSG